MLDWIRHYIESLSGAYILGRLLAMDVFLKAPKVGVDTEIDRLKPKEILLLIYAVFKSQSILVQINGEEVK